MTSVGPPAANDRFDLNRSTLLHITHESSFKTPGIKWTDDAPTSTPDTGGGRETQRMNACQAVWDAMSIILTKDNSAIMFGEDLGFGFGQGS